jgi:1,4-alpha-glucan branching enzyme
MKKKERKTKEKAGKGKKPPAADPPLVTGGLPPLKRKYSRDQTRCRVTFWLPQAAAPGAARVVLAGSFNNWSVDLHPMIRQDNGDFELEVKLESGREYEFGFLIDGVRWDNAWNADRYLWNDHAQRENSVIVT